jgi:hypothetical protein
MQSTLDQVIQHEAMVFLDCLKTEEHQLALSKLLAQMKLRNVKPHRSGSPPLLTRRALQDTLRSKKEG